jgi:hypothetical protein
MGTNEIPASVTPPSRKRLTAIEEFDTDSRTIRSGRP